jgi:hypothetical protein
VSARSTRVVERWSPTARTSAPSRNRSGPPVEPGRQQRFAVTGPDRRRGDPRAQRPQELCLPARRPGGVEEGGAPGRAGEDDGVHGGRAHRVDGPRDAGRVRGRPPPVDRDLHHVGALAPETVQQLGSVAPCSWTAIRRPARPRRRAGPPPPTVVSDAAAHSSTSPAALIAPYPWAPWRGSGRGEDGEQVRRPAGRVGVSIQPRKPIAV